jgi:hypothetical protein
MKTTVIGLLLLSTAISQAAPMYLPVQSATIQTQAIGENPACKAIIELDTSFKSISRAVLIIGDTEHNLPPEALRGIEYPDLSSLRIETEMGRDGRRWFSIVMRPARHTEYLTKYHISVIGGVFAQVSKSWDEPQGTSIRRHFEILHKEEQPNK